MDNYREIDKAAHTNLSWRPDTDAPAHADAGAAQTYGVFPESAHCHADQADNGSSANIETPDAYDEAMARKRELMERFAALVDAAFADEPPPSGIPEELWNALDEEKTEEAEESASDARALWEAMTAFAQQARLQGRMFKQICDALAPFQELPTLVESLIAAIAQSREQTDRALAAAADERAARERLIASQARQETQRETIGVLADLLERMRRGVDVARSHRQALSAHLKTGWFKKRARSDTRPLLDAALAQEEGYLLCCKRIEELLLKFNVREIECDHKLFDPAVMRAVEIETTTERPEGAVIEVYHPGFFWNDALLRPAMVKVARRPDTVR